LTASARVNVGTALTQLMNLLNPVELLLFPVELLLLLVPVVVPSVEVLPVPTVEVLPVPVCLVCFFVFVFAANVEVVRLPAVTSATAMTIAKIANAVDVFICIDEGKLSSIIDIA
jgi:hypothetical protein